jgi:hypothetical protein
MGGKNPLVLIIGKSGTTDLIEMIEKVGKNGPCLGVLQESPTFTQSPRTVLAYQPCASFRAASLIFEKGAF